MGLDYIGVCPECRRLLCWASERLATDDPKELSKCLAQYLRYGLSIERMETEAARKMDWFHADSCSKNSKAKPKRKTMPLFEKQAGAKP